MQAAIPCPELILTGIGLAFLQWCLVVMLPIGQQYTKINLTREHLNGFPSHYFTSAAFHEGVTPGDRQQNKLSAPWYVLVNAFARLPDSLDHFSAPCLHNLIVRAGSTQVLWSTLSSVLLQLQPGSSHKIGVQQLALRVDLLAEVLMSFNTQFALSLSLHI